MSIITEKIKYYLYRFKWFLAPIISFRTPIHLDLELNNNCNFKCVFCWHSQNKLPFEIKSISYDDAEYILYSAKKANIKSIKFNLRGEPTLYSNIEYILQKAKTLKFIDLMINTNGSKLEVIKKIYNYLNTIIISVDSSLPIEYNKIHDLNDEFFLIYLDVWKSIHFLKKNFKDKLKLNFHKNKINEESFDGNIDYLRRKGFNVVSRNTENRHGAKLSLSNHKKRKRICPHLMRRLTVLSNGKIYPCCVCYDEPTDIQLGHINNITLTQAWNLPKRKEIIRNYKNKIYTKSCANCTSGDIWHE